MKSTTSLGKPALFLDLDETIRVTHFIGQPVVLLPGREEIIRRWASTHVLIGVTNAGCISSYRTEQGRRAVYEAGEETQRLLGLRFTALLFGIDHKLKPDPAMAQIARDRYGLDLSASVMVGDSQEDEDFASAAGIPFTSVADFFTNKPRSKV